MATRTRTVQTYQNGVLVDTRTETYEVTTEQVTEETLVDYLTIRRARLLAIRTQAQAVSAKAQYATGQTATQLTTTVRDLQTDLKTLAAAVDDLAQYDIRLGRRVLGLYDATD